QEPDFARLPACERAKCDEAVALQHNSLLCRPLCRDDFAVRAQLPLRERVRRSTLFGSDRFGNERQSDQLAVQMGDGCAGTRALILEHEAITEPPVVAPVTQAFGVGLQYVAQLAF